MLHRYLSSSDPEDGLYHQRQAILRNSDTAQDGAWRLLMSMFAWRSGRRASKPITRLLPIIVFAFLLSAAFGVASIFSSRVTSEIVNEVLLKGTRCGTIDSSKGAENDLLTLLMPYYSEGANRHLVYGQKCYNNLTTDTDGCNLYIKPQLPLFSDRNASCPFKNNICKSETGNLVLDTGYLDSNADLGINAPPNERFQVRFVHQCAPIKTRGHMTPFNDSDYGAVMRYNYGQVATVTGGINFTYELPVNNAYLPEDGATSANIPRLDYSLGVETHRATPNESTIIQPNRWLPIPELIRDDADVHMLFLSAPEIRFSAPVNDPFFLANKGASELHNQDTTSTFSSYVQNEPLGVMACAIQLQYCNPNLPKGSNCEPLRGFLDPRASEEVKKIFTDDQQFAALKWADTLWTGSIYTVNIMVGYIGSSSLLARYGLSYGYQGPLPDNQWQLETEHWVKGTLASLQDVFVTAANGIPTALESFRESPAANETVALGMCKNQKIVSTAFSSFNVLGISLILLLGAWIIVLDMGLEPAVALWQRRRYQKHQLNDQYYGDGKEAHPLYSALEWSHNSTLQLQRLAHEEAGYATWSSCDGDTPVTLPGQQLAPLNLCDVKHPVLQRLETKSQWEVDREEWEGIVVAKPWGVKRSDTGLETLVEEMEEGKDGKKVDDETEGVILKALASPTSILVRQDGGGDWRIFR
jgi:hypothetical protein